MTGFIDISLMISARLLTLNFRKVQKQMISIIRNNPYSFLVIALAVYFGNFLIISNINENTGLGVPEWPIAFDFFLLIPICYVFIKRPPLKQAILAIFGLLSIGILIGSYIIPEANKQAWLVLENVRWLYLIGLVLLQAALLVSIGLAIKRNWHAPNLEVSVCNAISEHIPQTAVAKLLQADSRMWLYAFIKNPAKFRFDEPTFYSRTHDGNASNQQAFLILIAAEIPVAHLLIYFYSPMLAFVVSALSLYGLIFLYAEYRATLLRPTTIRDHEIHIRSGILDDTELPFHAIAACERVNYRPKRAKLEMRCIGTGTANIKLSLKPDTVLPTLFGEKKICTIYLGLDEPERFLRQISERIGDQKPVG